MNSAGTMPSPSPGPPRLSQLLARLAEAARGQHVSLGVLIDALEGRSDALMIFILTVPFLQPIPLPGVSTVFGLAIAVLGIQLARNRPVWLPRRLRDRALPRDLVERICVKGNALSLRFEHLIKPRWPVVCDTAWTKRVAGVVVAVAALLLALPLPIPVSNLLPALTIGLVSLGTIEGDGVVVGLGYVAFAMCLAFFFAIIGLPLLGLSRL